MEEIAPGIYSVEDSEYKDINPKGTTRVIDYIANNLPNVITGPLHLVKELSTHKEFSERSLCIAVLDAENNRLEKVFWFQGQQFFPKEHLEAAVDKKQISVLLANFPDADIEGVTNILGYMFPDKSATFEILDILWSKGRQTGSFLCQDPECCSGDGVSIDDYDSFSML